MTDVFWSLTKAEKNGDGPSELSADGTSSLNQKAKRYQGVTYLHFVCCYKESEREGPMQSSHEVHG